VKHDPTFWIVARAAGFAAYALLTATVLAGLLVKARPFGRRLRQASAVELHRTLSSMALGMLVLHGVALVLDTTVHISPAALVVPGLSPYRPLATGIGVVAAELMLLVAASFPLRRLIGMRSWRRLHWLTYAIFAGATVHGVLAGSDSGSRYALALYLASLGAVVAATTWRVVARATVPARAAAPARGSRRPAREAA
jgi:sulfoxide reductase heme-binding subunit YedZ